MTRIEQKYEQHAVKISSNGINGSGCVIHPLNSESSFIFTAKHCLTENGQVEKDKVTLSGPLISDKVEIKDIFIDPLHDVGIIQISRLNDYTSSLFVEPKKDLPVNLFGFPSLLKGESQILPCRVSFNKENYSEIELSQNQTTFEKSTPETIKGFSGSGIFHENANNLFIVGILVRLKACDGAYNNVCAYHISVFDNLLVEKGFSSLFEDNIFNIIYDLSFSFTAYNLGVEKFYLPRISDDQFNNSLKSPKSIWISGEPGVGKTLLVNRNLRTKGFNYIPIDLTTATLNNIDEYFRVINNEIIVQKDLQAFTDSENIYDTIASNLNKISHDEGLTIFVDEVPIRDSEIFNNFLSGFIKISEKYSNTTNGKNQVKWIISTRINPKSYLKGLNDCLVNNQKATKHFLYKHIDFWSYDELKALLILLEKNLNFHLSNFSHNKIIELSRGIPNPMKRVIEVILIDKCNIDEAIEIVKSENN